MAEQLALPDDNLPCPTCGQPKWQCDEKAARGLRCCARCKFSADPHGVKARQAQIDAAEAELARVDNRHRTNDHPTSVIGARRSARGALSHQMRLLQQYALRPVEGLTDGEAAHHANLQQPNSASPWKRCNELRDAHLIEQPESSPTRVGSYGAPGMVCVITDLGVDLLRSKNIYPTGGDNA